MGAHLQTKSGTREVKQCWQVDNNHILQQLRAGLFFFLPGIFTSDIIVMQEILKILNRMQQDLNPSLSSYAKTSKETQMKIIQIGETVESIPL